MHGSRRKRTSLTLLLVLAAGVAAAALAGAAGAGEMMCCPDGMQAEAGCTWLGAADCCAETPAVPASSSTAPPAPSACSVSFLPALAAHSAVLPSCAFTLANAKLLLRSTVLRL